MKIVVLLKEVPDTYTDRALNLETGLADRGASDPVVDEINAQQTLKLPHAEFRRLIDKTHFSMAQQDVRYYLNGMLLEAEGKQLRAVATDGHRLALAETTRSVMVGPGFGSRVSGFVQAGYGAARRAP